MTVRTTSSWPKAAARAFQKIAPDDQDRIRRALQRLASFPARDARRGKAIKTLQGTKDQFHRLRVGDFRIMYDLIVEDRVVLVLGIVHRSDLELWIRNR